MLPGCQLFAWPRLGEDNESGRGGGRGRADTGSNLIGRHEANAGLLFAPLPKA